MEKLLFFHHSGHVGGAGISLIHILDSIDRNKFDITVICPEDPKSLGLLLKEKGYRVVMLPEGVPIFYHYNGGSSFALGLTAMKNIFSIIKMYKKIIEIIETYNPDIVLINSMTLCWIGSIVKRYQKRSICFHRETYTKGLFGIRTRYIKYCLSKYFDRVAFISNYDCNQTGPINSLKKIVFDRVDENNFNKVEKINARSDLGFEDGVRYILFVGGLSRLKGTHLILSALRYIKTSNVKLVILGSLQSSNSNSIFDHTGIKERLKFLFGLNYSNRIFGYIKKHNLENMLIIKPPSFNIEKYFIASDLVVFPSTKGHQARPIYEAGIAQVPVLTTDFPNTKEFIRHGVTGYEFECGNYNDLAKVIDYIFCDDNIHSIIQNNYKQCIARNRLETLKIDIEELISC